MRIALLALAAAVALAAAKPPEFTNPELGTMKVWKDVNWVPDPSDSTGTKGRWTGWFRHDAVDARRLEQGVIRAKVEGRWQDFALVTLPPDFLDWNFTHRLGQLAGFRRMMAGEKFTPVLSGPHDGIVASHGAKRRDTRFTVNNAVKGIGWLPRREKLADFAELFRATWDAPMPRKLAVLESLYQHGDENFDLTCQTSLELYSRPGFETHTFLNQLADPGVALVFLDLPESYELRCIAQMLHPDDPGLTDHERAVVDYINLVHDYFHGESPRKSIGVLYHVVQVFDNSPPKGAGRRVVPPGEEPGK
ncbi:MAG: hypothetical protein R6X12_00745 [bacterium]